MSRARNLSLIQDGMDAMREEEYLRAFTLFDEAYASLGDASLKEQKAAEGLSYYALSLALVQKKYKQAIDLCRKALELQFYSGAHYVNLARVYIAAGNRKKAVETLDSGLKVVPDDQALTDMRDQMGRRARPAVPFLDRSNPINVALGRSRTTTPKKKPGDGSQER